MKKYTLKALCLSLIFISPYAFSSFKCVGAHGLTLQDLPCPQLKKESVPKIDFFTSNPEKFFNKYSQLHNQLSTSIIRLYSSYAKITIIKKSEDEEAKSIFLTGTQWKQKIITAFSNTQITMDTPSFTNIKVQKLTNRYLITAERHIKAKCYIDKSYSMVIRPHKTHGFKITKENLSTPPISNCYIQKEATTTP